MDIKGDMECQKAVGSITRNQCECGADYLKMVGYRVETKYGNLSTEKAELQFPVTGKGGARSDL